MASRLASCLCIVLATTVYAQTPAPETPHPGLVRVQTETAESRALWDRRLARMVRAGTLKVREERVVSPTARDQWLDQLHKGVPVVGGDVWRHVEAGALTAAEGTIYEKIDVNPVPKLTRLEARAAVTALQPGSAGPSRPPDLVVLPTADGHYVLAYRARVFTGPTLVLYYLDASTGAVVLTDATSGAPPPASR